MTAEEPSTDLIDRLRADWSRERPDLDTSGMAVVGRILHLAEGLRKEANACLKPFDIGYTDLDVLATLRRSGKPYLLRPAELLRTVLVQSGSLTACLLRLERRGLVTRLATPEDRRGLSVQLTAEGIDLIDRAIEARFEQARDWTAGQSTETLASLEEDLRRLVLGAAEPSEVG
ncbi:MAG: MarR family transcriptional regulator [Acidobacteriota bacterium]